MNFGFEKINEKDMIAGDYPSFGLNQGLIKSAEYVENSFGNSLKFVVGVKGKDYHIYVKEVTQIYKDGAWVDNDGSDEWAAAAEVLWKKTKGFTTHIVKSFTTLEAWETAVDKEKPKNFREWAEVIVGIFKVAEVDIFLRYQKKITNPKYSMKFTEIQSNMSDGYFIIPRTKDQWDMEINQDGSLSYVNPEGDTHKFTRTARFMESPYATKEANANTTAMLTGNNEGQPKPKKTWG